MKSRITHIGQSLVIRIPKRLLEQAGIREEVTVEKQGNSLIIRPASKPRQGWAESFRKMAENGDDRLIDNSSRLQSDWDTNGNGSALMLFNKSLTDHNGG